ncbi:DUF4132 domain-containing protein [Streptomyces sp. NBC_01465]|uniref:DUF4132 domain-containing protein n=1 Tax=Streptomyces sp. NBC_01465 TaxID=2903878 RepID=UPI002E335509|nr:DUF4132 domain-containing protein [Streptomyces sp. NBC_01465]
MSRLARELLKIATTNGNHWGGDGVSVLATVRALPEEARLRLANELIRISEPYDTESGAGADTLTLVGILARDLPVDLLSVERLRRLEEYGRMHSAWSTGELTALVATELAVGRVVPGPVVATMRRSVAQAYYPDPELNDLLSALPDPVVNPGEAWADRVLVELGERDDSWGAVVRHAVAATAARPTAKWERTARTLIEAEGMDGDALRSAVESWLGLVGRPRTWLFDTTGYSTSPNEEFDPYNANVLRGLTWLLALLPAHPGSARALGLLVETSLRKTPGIGPRSPKVANAGVVALSRMDGDAALAELARLASRVTYKGTLKLISTALDVRSAALGMSREEVEELAVPAYGLTEVGGSTHQLGECAAELTVVGSRVQIAWRNASGKQVKAVPAAVRGEHAEELKELKAAVKDIDKMLSAQVERLDRQFLARRTWTYGAWRARYLDHPLVGTLARRLLWSVDGTAVGFADGELRTVDDAPVTEGSSVELWHPVGRAPKEVVAWREWLERHRITQPFKQAHREVYLLTDAERTTRTYSNRFAAHVLRQHQFNSLAAVRGWHNKLRLCVDDHFPPATRALEAWGLRAEFWIDGVEEGDGHPALTDSGSYLWLRTDQVRFYTADTPTNSAHAGSGEYRRGWHQEPVEGVPLEEIPPLVLSEILRDVDLFVGVASVGNDPTWQDGGPGGRFRAYWNSYGFGELGQSAETRRELLAGLIPRLAIADRCTLEGRFLEVKGELHTYKIHLGSGNILMSPHDQYLCIVPKGVTPADPGYLPFEGDRTLAVILSKAMMLAKDKEITDRTILSQL